MFDYNKHVKLMIWMFHKSHKGEGSPLRCVRCVFRGIDAYDKTAKSLMREKIINDEV